jgi:hypothetical protein
MLKKSPHSHVLKVNIAQFDHYQNLMMYNSKLFTKVKHQYILVRCVPRCFSWIIRSLFHSFLRSHVIPWKERLLNDMSGSQCLAFQYGGNSKLSQNIPQSPRKIVYVLFKLPRKYSTDCNNFLRFMYMWKYIG